MPLFSVFIQVLQTGFEEKGKEDTYPSGKAPEKEDIKCIVQVHVVRKQRKMVVLTR